MTLTERYAEKFDVTKKEANAAIKSVAAAIIDALAEDGKAQMLDLGTFKVSTRAARIGRNPRTGETVKIPEKKTVKFAAAKSVKETL